MSVPTGLMIKVSDLIKRAEQQGCELRVSSAQLETPYGLKSIRYLYNPKNNGRLDITDLDDDEYIGVSEIAHAARRLMIFLP